MTDTKDTQPIEKPGSPWWAALKHALTDEDPMAQARRAKLQRGKALLATSSESLEMAAAGSDTRVHLSPMAAALLNQVLAKATAYTALTEKLEPLESIVVDERTRYQAAYALIKGSRSVEQVVQSIDMQHMQALESEVGRFAAQWREKERVEIEARSSASQSLRAGIDAGTQQIARLREELDTRVQEIETTIARDRERLVQVTQETDAKQRELSAVQRQFDMAAAAVKQALIGARATVLRHLA